MLARDLELFRCPSCSGPLAFAHSLPAGAVRNASLRCASCRARYPVRDGVPRLVLTKALDAGTAQSRRSFSDKWSRQPDYGTASEATRRFQHAWYLRRYGFGSTARLRRFLSSAKAILDAGTGLGRDTLWYESLSQARVYGLDLSSSVDILARRIDPTRTTVVQGDILRLPFADGAFDFVACDQVLTNIADPLAGIRALWKAVRPGGHLAFYVYRRLGPIREFVNDFLRATISPLSPARAWKVCQPITKLGKALSDLRATVRIPEDIPLLGIRKGSYDVQRFLYYSVMKCFWNDSHTFDENNLVNFDWYHPAFTFRYSEDEVRGWLRRLGMTPVHLDREEQSGISVLVRKSRRRR